MGCKLIDLTGKRFGKLVAIEPTEERYGNGSVVWKCQCDCGATTIVGSGNLRNGAVKSCGCLRRRLGEDHPNYKTSITDEERYEGRKYSNYYEWRDAVFARDKYTCQKCGDNRGKNLNAHHLEPYKTNPELRTTLSNGVTLCKQCHINFHHQYGFDVTSLQFNEYMGGAK